MQHESTLSPTIWYGCKEGSAAFGISQWNPSDDYFEWADENKLNANDIVVQLNRILLEVDGTIEQWQGWRHESNMSFDDYTHLNKSVEYLSEVYLRCYERPTITDERIAERAEDWSKFFLE